VNNIDFSGTGNANDFNIRWVLQSHRTCQVRSRVASEIAAKCQNNGLKVVAHFLLFFKEMSILKKPKRKKMPKLKKSA
jgi:hypothetical protein